MDICGRTLACETSFRLLISSVPSQNVDSWTDQFGRLTRWAREAGIGDLRKPPLEKRLEGASHITNALIGLLDSLGESITLCANLFESGPHGRPVDAVEGSPSVRDPPAIESYHVAEMEDHLENVTDVVDALQDMVYSVSNPAPVDMLTNRLFLEMDQLAESYDLAHVEAKFPSAPLLLASRLGNMNIKRRQYLWFQRKRNELAKEDVPHTKAPSRKTRSTDPSTILSRASSVFDAPLKNASHTITTGSMSSQALPEPKIVPVGQEVEVDSDTGSATSYAVTMSPSSSSRARIPKPPPAFYEGKPFQCMYCFKTLKTVKTARSWKRHVLLDLKPYVCLYGDCPEEARMFSRRRDWFQHELDVHRSYWECPRGCSEGFRSRSGFETHMMQVHNCSLNEKQRRNLSNACSRPQDERHKTDCGLCGKTFAVNATLRRHLGGEMEEIALFVMPRPHDFWDGSDDESGSEASDSGEEETSEYSNTPAAEANIGELYGREPGSHWQTRIDAPLVETYHEKPPSEESGPGSTFAAQNSPSPVAAERARYSHRWTPPARIPRHEWSKREPRIKELWAAGLTMEETLQILRKEAQDAGDSFDPSAAQYPSQLRDLGLISHGSKAKKHGEVSRHSEIGSDQETGPDLNDKTEVLRQGNDFIEELKTSPSDPLLLEVSVDDPAVPINSETGKLGSPSTEKAQKGAGAGQSTELEGFESTVAASPRSDASFDGFLEVARRASRGASVHSTNSKSPEEQEYRTEFQDAWAIDFDLAGSDANEEPSFWKGSSSIEANVPISDTASHAHTSANEPFPETELEVAGKSSAPFQPSGLIRQTTGPEAPVTLERIPPVRGSDPSSQFGNVFDSYISLESTAPATATQPLERPLELFRALRDSTPSLLHSSSSRGPASFQCTYPGCNAAPFQTQYLLNSHANVHADPRPYFCPVAGCPRGPGGKGFKRKNEMIRHGLVHESPGYICPFCPDQEHKYPRPDNLQRHVRVHHIDKNREDPQLQAVLAQLPEARRRPQIGA